VERDLRFIADGALDHDGIEALAARLGIGARHLGRLFSKHVGASPLQVARTSRVQRAKGILDETALPMAEVATRAGFGSLRALQYSFR
jgi:AraC family transcriptional regulator of adaptative response / DNA-3-methyladenine glycosylase II